MPQPPSFILPMAASSCIFVPGIPYLIGMTLLELACVGIPSLIICGERFEIETAKLLEKYGFGKNLGFGKNVSTKKLNSEISAIINDFNTRKSMKLCGQKLIDGNGVFRAKKLVQSLII